MAQNLTAQEEILLVQSAKSDLSAFAKIYDLYFPKLYGYVVYLVGNHADAEDIVSETFERAMINLQKYEYRGFTFGAWLFKIARNLVFDRSKAKETLSLSLDNFENTAINDFGTGQSLHSVENQVNDQIVAEKLKLMINNLKAEQREVVVLRYIDGYSISETAIITGRTEDSIKSACKRALIKLKEQLESES
ncbi:MAG: RNA polymerase, sigma-24 subunit, ECF subfamily [candidate division WS6 bacterium GW2011_GWA2_37_6]|uniref:RNA polymerase, sigma-24 subunit, ECF subfamily n=1 Tax=candidate division WS6 bacterium GW2011_GWA2_37_6 TaxID=1619087 RepID=A0A0G0HAD5_9BACT|nr:MAG: RNA polymerase, sigma-24 subunit, ECF subfamily [candidate division WS6 bacterium GW2011_GWA2_37_6]